MEMEQELAKTLLLEGATLVLMNVPVGTEFGIDLKSWTTGERFKGIKMIPPGIHMVYYNPKNKYGDVAPRISFVHNFKKSEFFVRHWDAEKEELSSEEFPEEEVNHIRSNLLNLDKFLGVYPFDVWKKWKKLSNYFTEDLILRLSPELGVIRSALELVACEGKETGGRRRCKTVEDKEAELLPSLEPVHGSNLRLTSLPQHSFPCGASPTDITKHSLDPTYMLDTMFNSLKSPNELLGEVQFSFVCFLIGLSMEALEHWTRLVSLICRCESAIQKRREFYSHFLRVLEVELSHIPEDFLVDIVASENVVYRGLRELFRNMAEGSHLEGRLRSEADRFKQRLTVKFAWDFDHLDREEDDEAPVIVELP